MKKKKKSFSLPAAESPFERLEKFVFNSNIYEMTRVGIEYKNL